MAETKGNSDPPCDPNDLRGRVVFLLCGSDVYADRADAEKAAAKLLIQEATEGPMKARPGFVQSLQGVLEQQGYAAAEQLWELHLRANADRHADTRNCSVWILEERIR